MTSATRQWPTLYIPGHVLHKNNPKPQSNKHLQPVLPFTPPDLKTTRTTSGLRTHNTEYQVTTAPTASNHPTTQHNTTTAHPRRAGPHTHTRSTDKPEPQPEPSPAAYHHSPLQPYAYPPPDSPWSGSGNLASHHPPSRPAGGLEVSLSRRVGRETDYS